MVLGLAVGPRAAAVTLGDVDGDGLVTPADARIALEAALGLRRVLPMDRVLYDIWPERGTTPSGAGDGRIDLDDARAVLRVALGARPPKRVHLLVTTVAGGEDGHRDGPVETALFSDPFDVAVGPDGALYTVDATRHCVRRIGQDGAVTTVAGIPSLHGGDRDGPSSRAQFRMPWGLTFGPDGVLYVVEHYGNRVRRIARDGTVSTVAGTGRAGFRDGPGRQAQFNNPMGIRADTDGNLFVADAYNHRIRKIDPAGNVTTLAGTGEFGYRDGPALAARFNLPCGVLPDPADGSLWIADMSNHAIRRLDASGMVHTVAGAGMAGFQDGRGPNAQFNQPFGFAFDVAHRLVIADWLNESVRVLNANGYVQTLAGDGAEGHVDGPGRRARFFGLMNVAVDSHGAIYCADTDNHRIRRILP